MAFDKTHLMISVSKPSPNQLFPGYGIVKVMFLLFSSFYLFTEEISFILRSSKPRLSTIEYI